MDIQVSICASATRPVTQNGFCNWERFLNSLKENKIKYEVIFVGDVKPNFDMNRFPEFKHIYATVKPAQAYEIAFRAAKGELIHWTADDADYLCKNPDTGQVQDDNLDRAYNKWKEMEEKYGNDKKSVVAFRPIEDGGDVHKFHHFFGGWQETPVMAPFALINRDYFVNKLGGYDRRFVSGQSENDVIMRVFEDGGRVEIGMDAVLYVHHRQVHPRKNGKEDNKFREWYPTDRQVLEDCWVIGGYGSYEQLNQSNNRNPEERSRIVKISPTRLSPVERFDNTHITTITQGLKGKW